MHTHTRTLTRNSCQWVTLPLFLLFAVLLLTSGAMAEAAAQKKNEPPPGALQQNSPDQDDYVPSPEDVEEKEREAARAAYVQKMRAAAQADVEAAAKSVRKADGRSLGVALRVETDPPAEPNLETAARSALRDLGDLDGDGHPEAIFRWSRVERFPRPESDALGKLPGWVMFLLSWDGRRWQVTLLMTGDGLSGVDTLEGIWPKDGIVVVEGLSNIPVPVIFRYENHSASIAWDARDESSRYQGYVGGAIEFEARDGAPPAMIVSGRGDPGVIRFSPRGQRGFEVATTYLWEGGAYVPKKTEFEENEDYTLYRFIAALHLRDFKTAFSLVDPASFLPDRGPTLREFQKMLEETRPEFLGNNIFEAVEGEGSAQQSFAFSLDRGTFRSFYDPTFRRDRKLLLTGLEKRDVKRAAEEEPPGAPPQ